MDIRIESDCDVLKGLNEYHTAFLNTNIKTKLIDDSDQLKLTDGILSFGIRHEPTLWSFGSGQKWPKGVPVKEGLIELASHLSQLAKNSQTSWLSTIIGKISVVEGALFLRTRFPISCLNEILTCPDFGVSNLLGHSFERFTLEQSNDSTLLKSLDRNLFHLLKTSSRQEGKRLYNQSKIDICWGVGVPPTFFLEPSEDFSVELDLPLHYLLSAGECLPNKSWNTAKSLLKSFHTTTPGLIATNSRLQILTPGQAESDKQNQTFDTTLKLYYSEFEPNAHIAKEISEHCSKKLEPIQVPYKEIVSNSTKLQDGVILSIRAPKHAGLIGKIPEIYCYLNRFRSDCDKSINVTQAFNETTVSRDLLAVEEAINNSFRQIVLAKMRPRFRSKTTIYLDQCGIVLLEKIKIQT